MTESLIKAKPLRLLYIPLAFSSVETRIRGFNGMVFLESFIDPVDLLFLYRENRCFWEEPAFHMFSQFIDPFKEGSWAESWAEDIRKAVEERTLKNLPVSDLTHDRLLFCEVFFNGNMLFLAERETQQHESFHEFYEAILDKMAEQMQCSVYQLYNIFAEFCRIDPILFVERKPTE